MKSLVNKKERKHFKNIEDDGLHNGVASMSMQERKQRTCLMCGKMFNSKGPYNRRCPKCAHLVESKIKSGLDLPRVYKIAYNDMSKYSR